MRNRSWNNSGRHIAISVIQDRNTTLKFGCVLIDLFETVEHVANIVHTTVSHVCSRISKMWVSLSSVAQKDQTNKYLTDIDV